MIFSHTEVMQELERLANPQRLEGMARVGINTQASLGISLYDLRKLAKTIGRDHHLALELWKSGIHEARLLACFVDDPKQVTPQQMEEWVLDFDSWDICDQCCTDLFDQTPYAWEKAFVWMEREEEFVRRAGFALIAGLAVHDKGSPDQRFEAFLPYLLRHATDGRNYVKKAVNWALRNIGKRSPSLNQMAVQTAFSMQALGDRTARWIAADALRELKSDKIQARFNKKNPQRGSQ